MAPVKKKLINAKKFYPKKIIAHTIATQVTGRDIDETFESMCEDPQTTFDIYNQCVFRRKKLKYPNLFLGGKILKTSSGSLGKQVAYNYGPQTIQKREENGQSQ